jgi:hypothetical protein
MNFCCIYESFDLNYLLALQLYLIEILSLDNNVLPRFVLIAFYNVLCLKRFACDFVFLLVGNGIMVPSFESRLKLIVCPVSMALYILTGNCNE